MGMTRSQKIIAAHCGLDRVEPGQIVNARVDFCMSNDVTSTVAIREFKRIRTARVFDKDRYAIILDHYSPCKDVASAEQCKTCRDFALEQGRDVYAVPGRITDPMSAGTNRLIYEGANIILSKEQAVSDFLGLSADHVWPRQNNVSDEHNSENSVDNSLEKDERVVYSIFDFYPKNLEEACKETDYSPLSFLSIVMKLCDKGLLREAFKNEYVKC